MSERPILFSAPMVRAILDGRKTQTRRIVKLNEAGRIARNGRQWHPDDPEAIKACPYGQPGDRLWVRETFYAWGRWETRYSAKKCRDEWHFIDMTPECEKRYRYAASMTGGAGPRERGGVTPAWWKRPAIFMPRHASRITLEIAGVRVEPLQDISEADAIAEGIEGSEVVINGRSQGKKWRDYGSRCDDPCEWFSSPILSYRSLWQQINGPESWGANPWVWVIEFARANHDSTQQDKAGGG